MLFTGMYYVVVSYSWRPMEQSAQLHVGRGFESISLLSLQYCLLHQLRTLMQAHVHL